MKILCVIIAVIGLSGCATQEGIERAISPQGMTVREMRTAGIPWGEQIGNIDEKHGWKTVRQEYVVLKQSPYFEDKIPEDPDRFHYLKRTVVNSNGFKFTMVYTYLDDEDGGNSYGWVEADGKRAGRIIDCRICK